MQQGPPGVAQNNPPGGANNALHLPLKLINYLLTKMTCGILSGLDVS
jgi:hypothetical protein